MSSSVFRPLRHQNTKKQQRNFPSFFLLQGKRLSQDSKGLTPGAFRELTKQSFSARKAILALISPQRSSFARCYNAIVPVTAASFDHLPPPPRYKGNATLLLHNLYQHPHGRRRARPGLFLLHPSLHTSSTSQHSFILSFFSSYLSPHSTCFITTFLDFMTFSPNLPIY